MYKIILFDLDGTIADSKEGMIKSVQYALKKVGINENDPNEVVSYIGPPFQEVFAAKYSLNTDQIERAIYYYREKYSEEGIYENHPFPGIPMLLEQLKKRKKILVIATSKLTLFAEKVLANFNLHHYFDLVVGSNLDGSRLTKTEVIEYAIGHFQQFNKEDIVMIGDRKQDIVGARNMGIKSIGVTYGYGTYEELLNVEPTSIVKSVKDLERVLLNLT